ncbi:RPR45-like archaeo-eukaryotic exosomal RNAse PH [Cryptosporidium bovis]|uniref:RPR45-like archaeo-eukaryotic exosomal RNAse PH n=1 Tax=Cryptosporidium bovis TaxID=310047 RepID=UPI00351A1336|nr:RPR45-like archaeo-eukaryotic exosomal RNAse PH [Cryptosporidium bovis]
MNKVKSSLWQLRPDEYLNRFLEKGVRSDGRKPEVCRRFKLEATKFGPDFASDSCESVKLSIRAGNSSYFSSCTPLIIKTSFEEKTNKLISNNRIIVNLEFPSICGFSGNSNYSTYISNTITECLNDQRVLNKDAFKSVVKNKEIHWVFNINIVCLSYDGNSLDYALMLAIASVINTKLPRHIFWDTNYNWFRFSSDKDIEKCEDFLVNDVHKDNLNGERGSLTCKPTYFKNIPIFVSFAYLNEKTWVCDPNSMEDSQGEVVSFCNIDDNNTTLQTQCIASYPSVGLHCDLNSLVRTVEKRAKEIREYLLEFKI